MQAFLQRIAPDTVLGRLLAKAPTFVIAVTCIILIAFSVIKIARQTMTPYPIDMWEAAAITVAARVANGEPMYRSMNEPDGIEPGLYSPLQPLALAVVFRFAGPSLVAARAINLLTGVAFIALFAYALRLHREPLLLLFGVAVLLMIDRQMTGLWDLPRADAVPLLCALAFIAAAYRACTTDRMSWMVIAHVILLIGLFWKQTILAVAPAPFLASLFTPNCSKRMRAACFLGPILLVATTVLAVAALSPNLFETMFRVGGRYSISMRLLGIYAYAFLLFTPLLWMGIWAVLFGPASHIIADLKWRWAMITVIAAAPLNFLAAAKIGGGPNSLAHCLYGMAAATLCCAPTMFALLRAAGPIAPIRNACLGIAIALALGIEWTTVFHTPSRVKLHRPYGDPGRPAVIEFARGLPGKVVSPQDPTLALAAKGYAGATAAYEWDRQLWKWPLPKVIRELETADYVITWGQTNTWQTWTFDEGIRLLPQLGFKPIPVPGLTNSSYAIWKRDGAKSP
ncbi:MAG TPA: hypothetical protein VK530_15045 [Candidatus Acidoferrum sp.]|nr:hypothetical protein [Candidatus Acidoferrum sp.]